MPSTPAELPEQLARRVMSWKTLFLAAAALVGLGMIIGAFRNVSAHEYSVHLKEEAATKSTVDADHAVIQYIHEDLEDIRAQNEANARTIGAPVVPRRSHDR